VSRKGENGTSISLPRRPGVLGNSPIGIRAETRPQKHFGELLVAKTLLSNSFHQFRVGKKCRNCSRGKIIPGKNDTFSPVVSRVPGIFPVESVPTMMPPETDLILT